MDELAVYYFHQGSTNKAYELLGCHYDSKGTTFRVFAPHAKFVSVVGDFNCWNLDRNPMNKVTSEGIFETYVRGVREYDCYQFAITTHDDRLIFKSDPYAFHAELRPNKNSKVYNLNKFCFTDDEWMEKRRNTNHYASPINIYELHLGSWKRYQDGNVFSYRKIAKELCDYVKKMGYTHIEVLPLSEYPYDPSWGYQVTGYYAVTSRYGTPEDFMYFVNYLHKNGIGVIMDWVPGHFTKDAFGLIDFDGEPLYEPSNQFKKENKGWGTRCFDYERCEVQSFLTSNAMFWCDKYHIDGLRVDAVSSMLYLDFGRNDGEWEKNFEGTNINLAAVAFLRKVNSSIHSYDPSIMMIAEESTAFPKVTEPISCGGLGFDFKWNMGWMNDTLRYISIDPMFRGDNLGLINFQLTYVFSEHYILALSHDEVVHLKKSIIDKMPGLYDQKFACVKAYMTYMMTHPGKKLNFMGYEFGQFREWSEDRELDFSCLQYERHQTLKEYIRKLNLIYLKHKALFDDTTYWEGFKWNVVDDRNHAVFSYTRKKDNDIILVILNFAYCEWPGYSFDVDKGNYEVILCSEDEKYSGSKLLEGSIYKSNGKLTIDLPYNCGIILRKKR